MTDEQRNLFDKLAEIRAYLADAMDLSAATGVKTTVVEKYSDQAHFIYELLQNADDTRATKAKFKLTNNGLYFSHNGSIHFNISKPDTLRDKKIEERDKINGQLGHVNSICSIGNSSKTIESNSIGKFGVGFKAVFQYTDTPHIYDPNFQFKIERFIVPVELKNDLPGRSRDETTFYFPFDKIDMPAEKAYSDILQKLKELVYPTLFLSNLKEVHWNANDESGAYTKEIYNKRKANGITYEKIQLFQKVGKNSNQHGLYLFSRRTENNHSYSVGYFLNENNELISKQLPAFCYFPTKEQTNLNFIIHAPFLLTESRESIKSFEGHNIEMCELISQLATDSLLVLRDLKLINDDIMRIIPYHRTNKNCRSPNY